MNRLGAELLPEGGVRFAVWAPRPSTLSLRIAGGADHEMVREGEVWSCVVPSARAGTRYAYVIDGERARPDPRSRFQPEGVHGPSEVIDPAGFAWRHAAPRRALAEQVIYELHVGTFTPEGTFAAAAGRLPALAELGVTAIELMPVAAFPGERNWGYDGVHMYAPCAAYGRPDDLRTLVDAAHALGLAVLLDVVYNHLGPEGNYLPEFAPYLHAQPTLWGEGPDFAVPEVRAWALDNARAWLREYRLDGLRLDAVHAISDDEKPHILAELTRAAEGLFIAETDMNEVKVFDEWGFAACWSDDFHHALHAALTGERHGYYADFGPVETLARVIHDGWVRGPEPRRARELPGERFVIAAQNHDQIGNRARGERLEQLVGASAARLAAVATLVGAPGVPLLFMGEEFGATAPFLYFTSHGDPGLAEAVARGRREEFAAFRWQGEVPDPQAPETFARSKLDWTEAARHQGRLALVRDLLELRRREPALGAGGKADTRAAARGPAVFIERGDAWLVVLNLDQREATHVDAEWRPVLHAEERRYGGSLDTPGRLVPPRGAAVFRRVR